MIGRERIGPTVFRLLRRGEMLAMLIDVASDDVGIRVDFFGAPALVSSAPARMALRTNAWVLPVVVVRAPEDDLVIRPIIDAGLRDFRPAGDEDHDVHELTRLIMRSMETTIREYPDQWFIFRRMWERPGLAHAAPAQLAEEL